MSHDVRCPECGRKLLEMDAGSGGVKCPRCGAVIDFGCRDGHVYAVARHKERKARRPHPPRK